MINRDIDIDHQSVALGDHGTYLLTRFIDRLTWKFNLFKSPR